MAQYEVEIRVKIIERGRTSEWVIQDEYVFGDNPQWVIAGAQAALTDSYGDMAERLDGLQLRDPSQDVLNDLSGRPRRHKEIF